MEISEIKKGFLEKLGIDINNLPEEFNRITASYSDSLTREERDFLFSDSYTKEFVLPFKMKDIVGTNHPDYQNKTFFEAFIASARGDENIKKFYSNPNYYSETLKQPDQSFKTALHDTPIELSRDAEGNCYIIGGNNRLNLLMMKYLAKLSVCKTEEEREILDNEYTFYAEIRALPQNRDVNNTIFLLKNFFKDNIKFTFKGENPDDCHYEITLNDQLIEVKSVDQLKLLLREAYNLSNSFTPAAMHQKLYDLIYAYINENNEIKRKLFLEICPNLELIKDQFLALRRINISANVFEGIDLSEVNYSNLSDILSERIIKEEQMIGLNGEVPSVPKM